MKYSRLNFGKVLSVLMEILLVLSFLATTPAIFSDSSTTIGVFPQNSTVSIGQTFAVNVTITAVANLTAWEFRLYYLSSVLNCTGVAEGPFLKTGGNNTYFTNTITNNYNSTHGRVIAGCALTGAVPGATGSGTLATVTFRARSGGETSLHLSDTKLGDEKIPPQPIPHTSVDGTVYVIGSSMSVEPLVSTAKMLNKVFDVNVTAQHVVNLYDFELTLHYNTSLLDVYTPYVQLGILMSGAAIYIFELNESLGYVHFAAKLKSPAPPVNGSGTLATVTFKVTNASIWPDPNLVCTLHLDSTELKTAAGTEILHGVVDGSYCYAPIIGDLTRDGTVDLDDIYIISSAYGSKPGDKNWNTIADLTRDGTINVLDLRTAARHYGEDC